MTNFDFLKEQKQFSSFANTAIAAERIFSIDAASCAINCRKAMELAIKWMYSVDTSLSMPYQEKLVTLLNTEGFQKIVGREILKRLNFIRALGNNAAHSTRAISKEQARYALENLFVFLDFVDYCYGKGDEEREFDSSLLEQEQAVPSSVPADATDATIEQLKAENMALREQLTARRDHQKQTYVQKPLDLSEYETRKVYIDTLLADAGWVQGQDWESEYPLEGMPNKAGVGYADYVLFGDDAKPLAVIEAKRGCKDVAAGRQQAKLYADLLEKKFGRRPIIFLTNGFDTHMWNDRYYPERVVSGVYSKRDLLKEFNKLDSRSSLKNILIREAITNRYYQKEAIQAVCRAFDSGNRRKALLVMATGSGKTRVVISLVDVLLRYGWIKNVLFLADRTSLVVQAKRAFSNLLPDLSITNLCEDKSNCTARGVFSTYQTMMNCIDEAKDEDGGKLFTCGHFDLIIVDEAHRSIYKKYKDIFTYFDAHIVGLTATPKDEIDKNTYEIFELESGVPTYGYELAQAVRDGFLVDFHSVETRLKFMESGITYDELSEEEKAEFEDCFTSENGEIPERIDSAALNEWVFNIDTIRQVLNTLMTHGIRADFGKNVGKTIIFAKNHKHAEKIVEIWNKDYPHYPSGYCRVIDNQTNYAQNAIDDFSDRQKLPQIAVSVDMLDTGIDVPEVVNLVFFKRVLSKAKFWQMIGRGTRLCPGLLDGEDKKEFLIFDFCNNFSFFRVGGKSVEAPVQRSIQEQVFNLKAQIVFKLQELEFQTDELRAFRSALVNELVAKVRELKREHFAVRLHVKYVDLYANPESYETLSYENILRIAEEVAPLIQPDSDEASAQRFDALMYGIELAYLTGKSYMRGRSDLVKKVRALSKLATIPDVLAQKEMIENILHTDMLERAEINVFEHIRNTLRELMKYIPKREQVLYETHFSDKLLSVEWKESELENDDLQNYKMKVSFYIRQHQDNPAIAKLRGNIPLTVSDIAILEDILWNELGSKEEYEKEYGAKPLGELVREIVGMDIQAAKAAFSHYLDEVQLDSRQSYFVNQIIEYIVQNGIMKDLSVLQESPFTDKGSLLELFEENTIILTKIRQSIEKININALVA